MKQKIIPKEQINSLLKILSKDYLVFMPAEINSTTKFKEFNENESYNLPEFQLTKVPPKEILFPKIDVLYSFKDLPDGGKEIQEPHVLLKEQIIFGIRNCDARSFKILDTFFASGRYRDTVYFNRREKTIFIGLACNHPLNTCFCTSVGGGPFSTEGLDAQLIEIDDKYIIKAMTERGEKILKLMKGYKEPSKEDIKGVEKLAESSNKEISTIDGIENIEKKLDTLFDSNIWDYCGKTCLGCGTCVFSCPTCTCFDVQDLKEKDGGKCVRIWDSCQFPLFTLEGSGHNPRNFKKQRVRQRIYHKFNYYVKNYEGLIGCIGCGRCIRACPAGASIINTLKEVIQEE